MGLSIFEDYLEAIKTYFVNNLGAHIAAINAEKADAYNIATMAKTIVGYEDYFSQNAYPVNFLFPEEFPHNDLSVGSDQWGVVLNCIIADTIGGDSAEGQYNNKIMRYYAAVWNLWRSDNTLGGNVDYSRIIGVRNYPPSIDSVGVVNIKIKISKQLNY